MALTPDDVRDYLGAQPGGPINMDQVAKALEAAEGRIGARLMPYVEPRPVAIDQAVTMLAARLYRRRNSVGGFEGFGELGIARVPALDPDVEELLSPYLAYHFG